MDTTSSGFMTDDPVTNNQEEEELSCDALRAITSSELLKLIQNGSSDFQATMYIPIPVYIIIFLIFIDLAIFHIRHSISWKRTRYTVFVVSVYPVLATTCFIGLFVPAAISLASFARSFYFAFVLVNFYKLLMHLYGGKRQAEIALMGDRVVSANPFPCCFICCCHNQPMTKARINKIRWVFYQAMFFFPLCFFFQTMLDVDGLTRRNRAAAVMSLFLQAISILSGFTCLYGFAVMGKSARYALQDYRIRGKYIAVSSIIACDTVQEFCIKVIDFAGGLPCGFPYPYSDRVNLWHSYILIYELLLISILAWVMFRDTYAGKRVRIKQGPDSPYINHNSSDIKIPLPDNMGSSHASSASFDVQKEEKEMPREMAV